MRCRASAAVLSQHRRSMVGFGRSWLISASSHPPASCGRATDIRLTYYAPSKEWNHYYVRRCFGLGRH